MMNSALARTMQTQRTTVTSRFANRSSRSRNFTASPNTQRAADYRRPEQRPAPLLEVLLAVENEGDRLLHAETLALLLHQPRYRLHKRRLVGRDDLGEAGLQRLQVFHFGNLPRATHVCLRARTGIE